jgi:hypothetical protein
VEITRKVAKCKPDVKVRSQRKYKYGAQTPGIFTNVNDPGRWADESDVYGNIP